MKQIKKFAAALLAIVMFATICPFGALADTDRQRDETNAIPEAVADVIAAINALSPVENLAYDLDDLELATSAVNNAEALYDELSDEEKAMVSNYVILLEAKDVIAARQFEKLVYDRLGELEEITLSSIPIVEEVHDAYDLLSTRQRSYVREYYITLFTDAINAINHEWDEVHAVEALISALPQVIEATDAEIESAQAVILQARGAYEALDDVQKNEVRNYSFLVSAEAALENASTILNVIDLISQIPEVIIPAHQQIIEAAREAYDALSEENMLLVTNYDYLVESEMVLDVVLAIEAIPEIINVENGTSIRKVRTALSNLDEEGIDYRVGNIIDLSNAEVVLEVVELIASIPFVISPEDADAIADAGDEYSLLSEELQDRVGNTDYLRDSEAVITVVSLIDEVLDLEPTIANKPSFVAADVQYYELTEEQRPRVGNYRNLATVLAIITNLEIEIADCKSLIAAIPFVLVPEDMETVAAARSAYNALNAEQKTYVDNYGYLVESEAVISAVLSIDEIPMPIMPEDAETIAVAREDYDELDGVARLERVGNADHLFYAEEALPVVLLIDEIPTEDLLLADTDFVSNVEAEYEDLSDEAKEYVGNRQTLFNAIDILNDLWAQVNNAIQALELVYSLSNRSLYVEDNGVITAARDAYDALNADQQNYIITNYAYLIPALEEAERVIAVVNAVAAIPKPLGAMDENGERHIEADRRAVDAANSAYLELSESERERVGNDEILDAAYAAIDVVVMIDALELDPVMIAYTEQIEAAREAYESLYDLAKEYVGNIDELMFAESELERLWNEINNAIDLIDRITFPVCLSDAPYINMVRGAYDALSDEQKTFVTNYNMLLYAERELCTLYGQVAIVMSCITALPYQVTLDDADTINAIWRAYYALTAEQQAEVTNLAKLQNATEQLAQLRAQVDEVIRLIDAIPELNDNNFDSFEAAVIAAREAYDAIANPVDAAYVVNYDVLIAAEGELVHIVIDMIDSMNSGELNDIDLVDIRANFEAALAVYNELSEELKSRVVNSGILTGLQELYAQAEVGISTVSQLFDYVLDLENGLPDPEDNPDEFTALYRNNSYYTDLVMDAFDLVYGPDNNLSEQQQRYIAHMLENDIIAMSAYDGVLSSYNPGHEPYNQDNYNEDGWLVLNDYVYSLYVPMRADVNGDGVIDLRDAVLLMRAAIGTYELTSVGSLAHDINGDGVINITDAITIMRQVLAS